MERKEEKIPQEVSPTNRKGGKKITSAVLKANRRNPRKIGLFAKELILTDEEKAEFQALSRALRVQLQPSTTLQYIGLDRIVCCCWRCKLALRREMQRFEMSSNLQVQSEGTSDPNTTARWYTAGRQELNSEIRWLETIKGDFENSGVVRAEWKQHMDIAFGPQFYESLTKWTPMNFQAILAAKNLDMHAKTYGMGDAFPGVEESCKLTLDPNQGYEMARKLIEQELRHLGDLHRSWEQRASESARVQTATSVDFWRYYTTACRDLERAVDWYLYSKKKL
jgi:hypothetical protein